ncbi:hypothetical protein GCM10023185_10080 [Hymenobacter saemangeumensis]|uniref:Cardiolipin synthase N-terminal domain-containing protein n=1 Tax=Hymenobacter saemangeumensis TaxID=1084522 RepID=A0ABP8I4Y2_9BACT
MYRLPTFLTRLPSLSLLLSACTALFLTACSGRRNDGSLTIFGVLYLIVAIAAVISLIKQDWSIGKKIIWGLIIWFFPFIGSIIYFMFSGRK